MAKRIQMRKNRFLALQKMAEQKKNEAMQVIKLKAMSVKTTTFLFNFCIATCN